MNIALGFKTHSGWAAMVALAAQHGQLQLIARQRIELVPADEPDPALLKQPYHAAEFLKPAAARTTVQRGIRSAHTHAARALRAVQRQAQTDGHRIASCAVLVGTPMPDWTVDQILSVHFRMHKAEGLLFQDALLAAANAAGLNALALREKELTDQAQSALGTRMRSLQTNIAALGKSAGPPWGKDQKDAALAAAVALAKSGAFAP